jgi:hypothetical protein
VSAARTKPVATTKPAAVPLVATRTRTGAPLTSREELAAAKNAPAPARPAATSSDLPPNAGTVVVRDIAPNPAEQLRAKESAARSLDRDALPLFSSTDADVQPAVLMRPRLRGDGRPVDVDETSVFDLIIDEWGRVEQVKLVSPGNRFSDRMLVASAKAWQFQPATKGGQPVRYRLRVPLRANY